MAITLNLTKSVPSLKLVLEKRGVTRMPQLEMNIVADVSGSFEDEHREGVTNDLFTRLAPWGLTFDPDKAVDVFTFSNGVASAHHAGVLTADNYQDFVARKIIGKVPGWNGATDYSYVLEKMLQHYGWMPKAAGFLDGLLGRKPKSAARKRTLCAFITDGDNNDHARTRQVLAASQQRGDDAYILFLGVSNQGAGSFPFLEKVADEFGNTGFKRIADVRSFVQKSDDEINDFLIDPELAAWLSKA